MKCPICHTPIQQEEIVRASDGMGEVICAGCNEYLEVNLVTGEVVVFAQG